MFGFLNLKKTAHVPLLLFNTLGKKKEAFEPLKGREVRMYNCGPTVYDYAHIGNLRSYIFADTLRRVLEYNGYAVKQVMNITDFGHLVADADEGEDKMTLALKREGKELTLANMKEVGEKYASAFFEDLTRLNIEEASVYPRASEHIGEQVAFVKTLLDKGYAYETNDGVYFDVAKFPKYGVLGGSASSEHSRIGVSKDKRDPRDFSLWKKDEHLGWISPWGTGFPGWHIECTAMSTKYLGKTFDIHTGGIDHIPVHHNNEIAQAEAATGKPYARYWLHGAFITVDGRRIGKSEGNAIRLYQLVERGLHPLAYRYLVLTSHYRQSMNFTWESLAGAQSALMRALRAFADLRGEGIIARAYQERFRAAVNDDLNTPEAIAVMWDLIKDESVAPGDKRATLLDFDRVLGLSFTKSEQEREGMLTVSVIALSEMPEDLQELLAKREAARTEKRFSDADRYREELRERGFDVEDTPQGQVVKKS